MSDDEDLSMRNLEVDEETDNQNIEELPKQKILQKKARTRKMIYREQTSINYFTYLPWVGLVIMALVVAFFAGMEYSRGNREGCAVNNTRWEICERDLKLKEQDLEGCLQNKNGNKKTEPNNGSTELQLVNSCQQRVEDLREELGHVKQEKKQIKEDYKLLETDYEKLQNETERCTKKRGEYVAQKEQESREQQKSDKFGSRNEV